MRSLPLTGFSHMYCVAAQSCELRCLLRPESVLLVSHGFIYRRLVNRFQAKSPAYMSKSYLFNISAFIAVLHNLSPDTSEGALFLANAFWDRMSQHPACPNRLSEHRKCMDGCFSTVHEKWSLSASGWRTALGWVVFALRGNLLI